MRTSTLVKRILQERIDGCDAIVLSPQFGIEATKNRLALKIQTYKEIITLIEQIEGTK